MALPPFSISVFVGRNFPHPPLRLSHLLQSGQMTRMMFGSDLSLVLRLSSTLISLIFCAALIPLRAVVSDTPARAAISPRVMSHDPDFMMRAEMTESAAISPTVM